MEDRRKPPENPGGSLDDDRNMRRIEGVLKVLSFKSRERGEL